MAIIAPIKPISGRRLRRRAKPKRPAYSIDLKEDRRKRKRVTVDELSARGREAIGDLPSTARDDKRSSVTKVLDLLDIPRNVVANVIGSLAGVDREGKRRGALLKKVYMSDVLDKLGVEKGAARSIAGFVGDVAIDPLTYLSLGASTGTQVAKHLPRLTGSAHKALNLAKKTGQISGELAKAIGPKRAAALAKSFTRTAQKQGLKAAKASTGRRLAKVLRGTAGRQEAGVLELFAKHGEKGRTLLHAPFAAKGVGHIGVGAKAKNYQAVQTAMTEGIGGAKSLRVAEKLKGSVKGLREAGAAKAGQIETLKGSLAATKAAGKESISAGRLASKDAVAAARAAKGEADEAYSAYLKKAGTGRTVTKPVRTSEVRLAEMRLKQAIKDKLHVGRARKALAEARKNAPKQTTLPPKRQALKTAAIMRKHSLTEARGKAAKTVPLLKKNLKADLAQIQSKIPPIEKGAAADTALAAKRSNKLRNILTGPHAPAVLKRAQEVTLGPGRPTGGGMMNLLRKAKHEAVGPASSPMRQRGVAIAQRSGPGAQAARVKMLDQMNREAAPLLQRLAQGGQYGSLDDVNAALSNLIEAGEGGQYLTNFAGSDSLRDAFAGLQRSGIIDEPGVREFIRRYGDDMQKMRLAEDARGIGKGAIGGYQHRVNTPEARASMRAQAAAGKAPPFTGGGRTKLVEIQMPGEPKPRLEVSTNTNEILDLIDAGGEIGGKFDISIAEYNARTAAGKAARGVVEPRFEGKLFGTDVVESAGARAAQHERRMAAADLTDLVDEYAVTVGQVDDKTISHAHLQRVHPPAPDSPFANLPIYADKMYPAPVADTINRLNKVWESPEAIESLLKGTDTLLGLWKAQALYHPSYVIRNIFQNFFGGLMAGANPAQVGVMSMRPEVKALRNAMVAGDPSVLRGGQMMLGQQPWALDTLYDIGTKLHMAGGGRVAQEIAPASLSKVVQKAGGARKLARKVHQAIFKLNTLVEDRQRLGTWLHFIDKGMDPTEAAMRTLKAMPDLADLTLWERNVASRVFPWWRWMRHNGALQLFEHLPQRPAYAAMMPRFKHFVEGFRKAGSVPDELRPMWQQDQMGIQVSGDDEGGSTWLAQNWFPFEDIYAVGSLAVGEPESGLRRMVSAMRPEIKFGAEAATGQSIFKQTPLQPISEGNLDPLSMMQGKTGTALDSVTQIRPVREYGPGGRVSEMPTVGAAATRAVLGGALQPIDRERGLMGRYYELNALQQDLRAQYNRALNAGDQALANSLYNQWLSIQRQMYQYAFPVSQPMEQMFAEAGTDRPGPPR